MPVDKLTHAQRLRLRLEAMSHAGMSYDHWPVLARKKPGVTVLPVERGAEPSLDDLFDRAERIEAWLWEAKEPAAAQGASLFGGGDAAAGNSLKYMSPSELFEHFGKKEQADAEGLPLQRLDRERRRDHRDPVVEAEIEAIRMRAVARAEAAEARPADTVTQDDAMLSHRMLSHRWPKLKPDNPLAIVMCEGCGAREGSLASQAWCPTSPAVALRPEKTGDVDHRARVHDGPDLPPGDHRADNGELPRPTEPPPPCRCRVSVAFSTVKGTWHDRDCAMWASDRPPVPLPPVAVEREP